MLLLDFMFYSSTTECFYEWQGYNFQNAFEYDGTVSTTKQDVIEDVDLIAHYTGYYRENFRQLCYNGQNKDFDVINQFTFWTVPDCYKGASQLKNNFLSKQDYPGSWNHKK